MIATIGTILVWALIVIAGAAGLLFAFIGFMFFINWPK
nr:MAG TPA: syndecan-2 protein [Caudoviricetes sp.]